MVLNLADSGGFGMVVKDLGGEKVDYTREQHAHHQGVNPVLVPRFSPASHLRDFALSCLEFNLPA